MIKYIFPVVIFMLGFSCDNNETETKTDDKCGYNSAKFIKNWCVDDLAVIEILTNKNMGEDWTSSDGKTYHHTVLAVIDSTLSKPNEIWNRVKGSSDSVFYFNFVSKQFDVGCKLCCPPTKTISITFVASRPYPLTSGI